MPPLVRRVLMDEIDWNNRLIGIKGPRGVGKTYFLLEYAREYFGLDNRACLYINLNHFYFTECSLINFVTEFKAKGGHTLLLDQVFKYPDWANELSYCYNHFPDIHIVFTGPSVIQLKTENLALSGKVDSYNLRGFSFREFLNLMTEADFPTITLQDILKDHKEIAREICRKVKPLAFFHDYVHHGYYPFFLENRNFSENLLKTMNMTLEVDVLYIKQIEQTYLPKLRKLLYLLAVTTPQTLNISQLSKELEISRATVMNYIKYLTDARLTNMLYQVGDIFPKKPTKVYLNNSNLVYPIRPMAVNEQSVRKSFFYNQMHKAYKVNAGGKNGDFLIDYKYNFCVVNSRRIRNSSDLYYAVDNIEVGENNMIPLWLFGFTY